jgi:hypothetical protein
VPIGDFHQRGNLTRCEFFETTKEENIMATSKANQKNIEKANSFALDFNTHTVAEVFRAVNEKRSLIDSATGEMQSASTALVLEAHRVAEKAREQGADGETIAKGWSAEVRAMLPMLAVEGCSFVEESTKKPGQFRLTGYGQNINSTARGFCEYPELDPEAARNDDGELTYSGLVSALTEEKRKHEDAEVTALREAKEALTESIKAFRKAAGVTAQSITDAAELLDVLTGELAPVEEAEAENDDTETEVSKAA